MEKRPFAIAEETPDGPLAVLTRATIRPRILHKFWGRVPGISEVIGRDPNVIFKIGVGEIPWLHQVTFSIWPDTETMSAFAHEDGPHARAIRAVREGKLVLPKSFMRGLLWLGRLGVGTGRNGLQVTQ